MVLTGRAERFDGIVLGTGFTVDLPFLGDDVLSARNVAPTLMMTLFSAKWT